MLWGLLRTLVFYGPAKETPPLCVICCTQEVEFRGFLLEIHRCVHVHKGGLALAPGLRGGGGRIEDSHGGKCRTVNGAEGGGGCGGIDIWYAKVQIANRHCLSI